MVGLAAFGPPCNSTPPDDHDSSATYSCAYPALLCQKEPTGPMTTPNPHPARNVTILTTLKTRWWLWGVPTVLTVVLAAAYAAFRPDVWEASQALVVRDETVGRLGRQGRFESNDSRKAAHETVLEMARNPGVVAGALAKIGPPDAARQPAVWPGENDIRQTTEAVTLAAPKGIDLGASEVIYLTVRQSTRDRAVALNRALCDQLDARLQGLRNSRAESLIRELQRTASLAQRDLDAATRQLQALESRVGSDLGELRTLAEAGNGEGTLRSAMNKIKEELRQARANQYTQQQQLDLLKAAIRDPQRLVAVPNQLLDSQPALRRLKDGLIDAQLQTAKILGRTNEAHPDARAALAAEEEIRQSLQEELAVAIRGLEAGSTVTAGLVAMLEGQLTDAQNRLARLAELRSPYANLVAEVRQRTQTLEEAEKALADGRASQSAAQSASLITRIDQPQTGNRPVGLGRATTVLCGLVAGLTCGAGFLFLAAPVGGGARRWSDYLPGRRWSDQIRGRRGSDRPANPAPAAAPTGRRASDLPPPPPVANSPDNRRSGQDRRAAG